MKSREHKMEPAVKAEEGSRTIEDILQKEGIYVGTTAGVSMYPMLRDRRDTIVIRPCRGRLKKYDVPLYRRGDAYILHRIVRVLPDSYVICGDNCLRREYGVTDQQILGVLTEFYRGDTWINMNGLAYKGYVRFWCFIYPARFCCKALLGRVKCLLKGERIRC